MEEDALSKLPPGLGPEGQLVGQEVRACRTGFRDAFFILDTLARNGQRVPSFFPQ